MLVPSPGALRRARRRRWAPGGTPPSRKPSSVNEPRSSEPATPAEAGATNGSGGVVGTLRTALPEGTFALGGGLIVAAITAYVFVIVVQNKLGTREWAGFSAFWALVFVVGPGLFLPIEQEVSRAIAARRAQGLGGGPLVSRAARLAGGLLVVTIVAITAVELLGGGVISDNLFHGEQGLVWALEFGLVGFFTMHLTRGVLSGNGRFGPYGVMMAAEGTFRLLGAIGLAVAGVEMAGLYGACIGGASFIAVAVALAMARPRTLVADGPPAPYSELSTALAWLLVGSVFMQLLGYTPLLGVNLLESGTDKAAAAAFASAFFIARIPVLLFQAVQGTLLPKLAGLAGAGRAKDFRDGLLRLLVVVVGIAVLGTIGALVLGPFAGRILFKDFSMSASNLALLAAGSGAFIVALTIAQALIAVNAYTRVAFSWVAGVVVFLVVCAGIDDLFLRVELGFLAGAGASCALMLLQLRSAMARGLSADRLLEAFEHEPLEL